MQSSNEHPWTGSYEEFMAHVLPKLQEHGKVIGAAANAGDETASELVARYTMLHRSYDPMTAMLVESLLKKWLASH